MSFWPFAEALADRITCTVCTDIEPFRVSEACGILAGHMRKSRVPMASESEHERDLYIAEASSLMIGVALGRRLGPQPR